MFGRSDQSQELECQAWRFLSKPVGFRTRGAPSFADEQTWCDLGALEARSDPTSIFPMQNLARIEAQKAFAHIDISKRVQRSLLRNAQPYTMNYQVGLDTEKPLGQRQVGLSVLKETRTVGF